MLKLLGLQVVLGSRYGFAGMQGMFGVIVGLIVFTVIAILLWKMADAVIPKLTQDAGWQAFIHWGLVLITFLAFLHFVGFY
jgi:hypothetical protein